MIQIWGEILLAPVDKATMIDQLLKMGWRAVELTLLTAILCITLNILLGNDGGSFISAVANNAQRFFKEIPSGTFLSIVLIVFLWQYKIRPQK